MPHLQPLAVLNVVGLSGSLLPHAPNLRRLAERGHATRLRPVLPAVTCSVQSSMLTGRPVDGPDGHGVVGNGWFNQEQQEIQFWKQSNRLVHGEKVWETARNIAYQNGMDYRGTANLFWWFNMGSSADVAVTPRPQYRANGQKVPDIWTHPALERDLLQAQLGQFPLFRFWGPGSDLTSSRWIADAAMRVVDRHEPSLTLVYLPHLDYGLQKLGPGHPDIPKHVADIDAVVGDLIAFFAQRGTRVIALSEYGIEPVSKPIHVNRQLRDAGLLRVREEGGHELLDPIASQAFAVADHQVAHVYHDPDVQLPDITNCTAERMDHPRAGQTVLIADAGAWFTYDYWPADRPDKAPDFARIVEIHRKPGYDPRELFLDVNKASLAWKLVKKKLGFAQPLDVIPLDATRVKGSHGRTNNPEHLQPVMLGEHDITQDETPCTAVRDTVRSAMFGNAFVPDQT
ncbi:MAG: nucleotide pyrophosphatase/phosphodiesterase family protein [Planctomycetota bacterium]